MSVFQSSPKKQALTTSEQREQTRLSETPHDFVNAKRSAKESQQSGCGLVVAHFIETHGTSIAIAHASPGNTPLVAICAALVRALAPAEISTTAARDRAPIYRVGCAATQRKAANAAAAGSAAG